MDSIMQSLIGAVGGGGVVAVVVTLLLHHSLAQDRVERQTLAEQVQRLEREKFAELTQRLEAHLEQDNPGVTDQRLRQLDGTMLRVLDRLERVSDEVAKLSSASAENREFIRNVHDALKDLRSDFYKTQKRS